jgi:hypothetical protein
LCQYGFGEEEPFDKAQGKKEKEEFFHGFDFSILF